MSKVIILQHIECEPAGLIEEVLRQNKIDLEVISGYLGNAIPPASDALDGLVIMGGPMGVYEEDKYPFLRQEILLIQDAVKRKKPVLGICLGSQLLAKALGSEVTKGPQKEIGFPPVTLTESGKSDFLFRDLPKNFPALHWHGDIFSLPKDASLLASSELTTHQAFRYGDSAYGLLFHLEVTKPILENWLNVFQEELKSEGIPKSKFEKGSRQLLLMNEMGKKVFERWMSLILLTRTQM